MIWQKLGRVWAPDASVPWAKTHAHLPTPFRLDDRRIRVYFACLDENRFGRISFVDVAADDPTKVLYVSKDVALDIGALGAFDDCGAVPSCAIAFRGRLLLYYVGFQRAFRVPYMLFSGLATAGENASRFSRARVTPILDRTPEEPYSRGAPFVWTEGSQLRMWYWTCTEWTESRGLVHYNNVIRTATSQDGVDWKVDPGDCIAPTNDEYAVGRPWVIRSGAGYRMFYSVRSHSERYFIGVAESVDGVRWSRKDEESGIRRSESGWDSEMVCYPALIETNGRRFMFYNGNGHGATGFGCAECIED